jgi:hypothetical protein
MVPSKELVTPLPAVGLAVVVSGGQIEAHEPVQVLELEVSELNM